MHSWVASKSGVQPLFFMMIIAYRKEILGNLIKYLIAPSIQQSECLKMSKEALPVGES